MKRSHLIASVAAACVACLGLLSAGGNDFILSYWLRGWPGFAYNAQHQALSPAPTQPLVNIHWQTPVDVGPQNGATHYGSPVVTARNNVVVAVKTTVGGAFRLDCRKGSNGALLWSQTTDYVLPQPFRPSCVSTLTPNDSLATPAIGGTVLLRYCADLASSGVTRQAFFGLGNYNAAQATYNSAVKINTPITTDSQGNLYFGFIATGPTPANLVSGLARLDMQGNGTWISAATAAADATMTQVSTNCAPAVSLDGQVVYVSVCNSNYIGYLLGLSTTTLTPLYKVRLKDPSSGQDAVVANMSTSSPSVGPDNEVYYGVMENPFFVNNDRGWMLHFDATLTTTLTPGAFGWDITPSLLPSSAVPQYTGTSPYLLVTEYNNYAGYGTGDGLNKVAVLDPHVSQIDPITGTTIMNEILVKLGPTPDPPHQGPGSPNAVREWCTNSAAVDAATKGAIVNNEDGKLYRWDFATNTLSQVVTLTPPGHTHDESATCVGPDGTVYVIYNAILFAVGQ